MSSTEGGDGDGGVADGKIKVVPSNHITSIPIAQRPPASTVHSLIFNTFFMLSMMLVHTFQLALLPLLLVPEARPTFWNLIRWTKAWYGMLLTFISMSFGRTKIVLTADGQSVDLRELVRVDESGEVVGLDLPPRAVWMGNHQIYADWLYLWIILYFGRLHDSIIIIIKKGFEWIPIVGPAMQLFKFIFISRNWNADRINLTRHLNDMGSFAEREKGPLNLLIFPEGTLVSSQTRPASKKFSEKIGVPDLRYTLLPRSTGLLFCLRSLAAKIETLELWDATMIYSSMPAFSSQSSSSSSTEKPIPAYGQDYFTLQSIFGAGQAPEAVHIHLRKWKVGGPRSEPGIQEIPIGKFDADLQKKVPGSGGEKEGVGALTTEEEKKVFDDWLRSRWVEKDEMLDRFYHHQDPSKRFIIDPTLEKCRGGESSPHPAYLSSDSTEAERRGDGKNHIRTPTNWEVMGTKIGDRLISPQGPVEINIKLLNVHDLVFMFAIMVPGVLIWRFVAGLVLGFIWRRVFG